MSDLDNLYRLLSSPDPDMILLGLQIAEGQELDWGLDDYVEWANLLTKTSNSDFAAATNTDPILRAIQIVHHCKSTMRLDLRAGMPPLPGHAERLLQLTNLIISSDGNLAPILENPYLVQRCRTLLLKEKNMSIVPESIAHFTALQKLDLSHNLITEIPATLGDLRQLRSLHIQFNQISALPETLCQLQNLQSLWLAKNQFQQLPKWLPQLQNLRMLYIFDNPLDKEALEHTKKAMPDCMFFDR